MWRTDQKTASDNLIETEINIYEMNANGTGEKLS
jgi:hypothetical protein